MEKTFLAGSLRNYPIYDSVEELRTTHGDSENQSMSKKRKNWRRQSSEGSFIHITGTGTILEETASKTHQSDFEDIPSGIGQYENFHTIDWLKDLARDRFRHSYIAGRMHRSFWESFSGYYDACSGWICVFLVGLLAGSVSAFIDIGEGWMKDLKIGICPQAFWLNKEQCCWASNTTFYEGDLCDEWYNWFELTSIHLPEVETYALSYVMYILWSLFLGLLSGCMVKTLAPYACGSGIPEIKTILSGFIMRGYLGKMTLLVKSVAMMLAVSAGLSLGKEGPLVHVVCCIGNVFSYFFPKYAKNEAKKREILSAASAAGVSVAFNAPIGGVLFSLEEVSYYFPLKTLWRSFFCALVAAFVLRSINPFGTDHPIKYYITDKRSWIMIELIPFVLLGILGGAIGTAFIRGNIAWWKIKRNTKIGKFPILEVFCVTFITAVIKYPNEFTRINASDLIKVLFAECGKEEISLLCGYRKNSSLFGNHTEVIDIDSEIQKALYLLALAFISTYLLTVFTYGLKVPAGLFVPSMAMGAIIGRIVGIGMQKLAIAHRHSWLFRSACMVNEDCLSPGMYAMIGAAACLAGVTRMTVSLVVIMFELTGCVECIVPLMATVVASKWVGDALYKEGIYDAHIHLWEYPFLSNKEGFRHSRTIAEIACIRKSRSSLQCLVERMTLEEIEHFLEKNSHNGFPIIVSKETPHLVGYVLRRDVLLAIDVLKSHKEDITKKSIIYFSNSFKQTKDNSTIIVLTKIVDMAPITVTIQTQTETLVDMFCKMGLRQVLVTEKGTLIDIITKKDLLSYIQEINNADMLHKQDK